MFKNWLRYGLPATIIALALLGISLATNLQSWQSGSTGNVAAIDGGGGFSITGSGAFNFSPPGVSSLSGSGTITGGTLAGGTMTGGTLTAGTLSVFMPHQGAYFKTLVISATAVTATGGTMGFALPTPFTNFAGSSGTMLNTSAGSQLMGCVLTAGTGGVLTVASTGSTGVLIMAGK